MLGNLPAEKIEETFLSALDDVKGYIQEYTVNCSTNIEFIGFNEELLHPIKAWFNKKDKKFYFTFSIYYIKNQKEKVKNYFIRYILTTNTDGTFKTHEDALAMAQKVQSIFLDTTFTQNYLNCSKELNPNVFCVSCKATYTYDENSNVYQNLDKYMCICGGELVKIKDYSPSDFVKHHYTIGTYHTNLRKFDPTFFTEQFFSSIPHTESDFKYFTNFIKKKTIMSKKILIGEVRNAIEANNINLLKMFRHAFAPSYSGCYKDLKKAHKEYIEQHCPPTNIRLLQQENKKQPIVLNRNEYNCTDYEFSLISTYLNKKKTATNLRSMITRAFDENNNVFLKCIVKADSDGCKKILRYLRVADRNRLNELIKKKDDTQC